MITACLGSKLILDTLEFILIAARTSDPISTISEASAGARPTEPPALPENLNWGLLYPQAQWK